MPQCRHIEQLNGEAAIAGMPSIAAFGARMRGSGRALVRQLSHAAHQDSINATLRWWSVSIPVQAKTV